MDEEASFANLLASTAQLSRPSWDAPTASTADTADPWANPFASESAASPFASYSAPAPAPGLGPGPSASTSTFQPDSPREQVSPYVQRLQDDAEQGLGKAPDPPSVIAARERGQDTFAQPAYASSAFGTPVDDHVDPFAPNPFAPAHSHTSDPAHAPFVPPASAPVHLEPQPAPAPKSKGLPASLIDEDLMAASDPEQSLKKAFVKSKPKPSADAKTSAPSTPSKEKKAYVFTPGKKEAKEGKPAEDEIKPAEKEAKAPEKVDERNGDGDDDGDGDGDVDRLVEKEEDQADQKQEVMADDAQKDIVPEIAPIEVKETNGEAKVDVTTPTKTDIPSSEAHDTTPTATTPTLTAKSPTSIPLPSSALPTPTVSRVPTPLPPPKADAHDSSSALATPSTDRVSVSPLDAPTVPQEEDYGFKSLSIGGSALDAPPVPVKDEGAWPGTDARVTATATATSPPTSRFGGKGWGAMDDDEDDGGLFGKGGHGHAPTPTPKPDLWGGNDTSVGWGEASLEESLSITPGPSSSRFSSNGVESPTRLDTSTSSSASVGPTSPEGSTSQATPTSSPRKKLSSIPVFQVSVGDPTKVGDPVRGYTVYTVRTQTTSPHYRQGSFSVLRRFSDFLWLFDVLTANNPGVIVPPVPGKHTFGRFQDQFIETRRSALQRCLGKITSHPVLQLDPDLRLFLESDSFAYESKARRQDIQAAEKQSASLLSGWTGPKFVEHDDWFESRRNFLDSLESQLKALSKSIDVSSKNRLELSLSIAEFGETITALAESDLGTALSSALGQLASIAEKEKENGEEQAKEEVVRLLNLADEYIRFIGSVRGAFGGRIKAWNSWQNMEKEVTRLKAQREKLRAQGKLGDRVQSSLAEVAEAERRARELHATFEHLSRLTKSEFVRFERGRVEEFKSTLEEYLEGMAGREKELIERWEGLHKFLLKLVGQQAQ